MRFKITDGRQAVVRNGYLPERTIQTVLGCDYQSSKVRDRSGSGIHLLARCYPLLTAYQKYRELIPWLYLKAYRRRLF